MVPGFIFFFVFFKDDFSRSLTGQLRERRETVERLWGKMCCKGPQTGIGSRPLLRTQSPAWVACSTGWAIRAPWCCFSMRGSCFCLLCSFLSCVCALILMHSMNYFLTLFLLLYFHHYFYYYYVVGIFFIFWIHLLSFIFILCMFYVIFLSSTWCMQLFWFGSTWSCISCMKGAIQNSLLLVCLQENATGHLSYETQ